MLGQAVGGALSIGGALYGGMKASQAMKQIGANLAKRQKENEDWYNMRYNEDATQRADAQRMLEMTRQAIRNRNRQAAATQAVMGGTNESLAATRAANAQAMSDAASQITMAGEQRKSAIENQYLTTKDKLADAQNQMLSDKAKALGEMASEIGEVGNNIATKWA